MLLKQSTLRAFGRGSVVTAYRRWQRPLVKPGSTFRSPVGVLSVEEIEPTTLQAITEPAARRAGYDSRSLLLDELKRHRGGQLYRISLRRAGPDPRTALRARARLTENERAVLLKKLASLGARGAEGPWARSVLHLIGARPSVRAAELAEALGVETARFKARVRQLKDMGLTESLERGYRLSPRGRAVLGQLRAQEGGR